MKEDEDEATIEQYYEGAANPSKHIEHIHHRTNIRCRYQYLFKQIHEYCRDNKHS